MALLTKDFILGLQDLVTEDVPAWGGTVRLKTLTGVQRDAFEASTVRMVKDKQVPNIENIRARLVALCMVDESGNRVFSDADISLLGGKSSKTLDMLFEKCQEMNGLSDKDVEKLTEGFEQGQSGLSTSV